MPSEVPFVNVESPHVRSIEEGDSHHMLVRGRAEIKILNDSIDGRLGFRGFALAGLEKDYEAAVDEMVAQGEVDPAWAYCKLQFQHGHLRRGDGEVDGVRVGVGEELGVGWAAMPCHLSQEA